MYTNVNADQIGIVAMGDNISIRFEEKPTIIADKKLIKVYLEAISDYISQLDWNGEPVLERQVSPIKKSFHLGPKDISDAKGLATRIRDEADKFAKYIKGNLSTTSVELIGNVEAIGSNQQALRRALVKDLNEILDGPSLWEIGLFEKNQLTDEMKDLLNQAPQGSALVHLNRLLLTAAFSSAIKNVLPDALSLYETLKQEEKIVLLAEPGAGKTTELRSLTKNVASHSLEFWREEYPHEILIPIYVELKYYRGERELETLLAQVMNGYLGICNNTMATTLADSAQVVKVWMLEEGIRFCLLFDGLNEVPTQFHSDIRRILMTVLNSRHYVAVSCREKDYDESLQLAASAFGLRNLNPQEIKTYLKDALGRKEGERFYYKHFSHDEKLLALASNPLMLWLIKEVAVKNPDADLPKNRGRLIREFATRLPIVRRREGIYSGVAVDIVSSVLAHMAFQMQTSGELFVDLGRIRDWNLRTDHLSLDETLIQAKDWRFLKSDGSTGEPIEFLHQLFLEYFAAAYLARLLKSSNNYSDLLSNSVIDDKWHEVISMLAGISNDPKGLIEWLIAEAINNERARLSELVLDCTETTEFAVNLATEHRYIRAIVAGLGEYSPGSFREYRLVNALIAIAKTVVEPFIEIIQDLNQRQHFLAPDTKGEKDPVDVHSEVGGKIFAGYLQRRSIIRVLENTQGERAINLMVELLADDETDSYRSDIRRAASNALREFGKQGIVPLLRAISDTSQPTSIRGYCLIALMKIGFRSTDASLVLDSCLREGLLGNGELFKKSLWVASQLGDQSQTLHALNALHSVDHEILSSAASFLTRVPSDTSFEPLTKLLYRWRQLKAHPFSSIWGLEQILRALNALNTEAANGVVRKYIAKSLDSVELLDFHAALRLADEMDVKGIRPIALTKLLTSLDSQEEARGLRSLFEFVGKAWLPDLLSELKRSARQPRQAGIFALPKRISKENKKLRRWQEWGEGSNYQQVISVLAKCQVSNFVEQISEMLPKADWLVEKELCDALWITADAHAEEPLIHKLESVSELETKQHLDKYHVIRALATCGKEKGVKAALNYIRNNPNLSIYLPEEVLLPMVRRRVLPTLELERMALDSDGTHVFVREFCIQTLGYLNAPRYSDLFCKIIDESEEERLRSYAIRLLGWAKGRGVIQKLKEILRTTGSSSVATDVTGALFRLGAKDAIKEVNKAVERFAGEKYIPNLLRAAARWRSMSTLAYIKTIITEKHTWGNSIDELPAAIGEFYEDPWARNKVNECLESASRRIDFGEQAQALKAIAKHDLNLALTEFIRLSDLSQITENSQLVVIWKLPDWAIDTQINLELLVSALMRLLCDFDVNIREQAGEVLSMLERNVCERVFEGLNSMREDWAMAAAVHSLGYWSDNEENIKSYLYDPTHVVRYFAERALKVRKRQNAMRKLVRMFLSTSGVSRFAAFQCLAEQGTESVISSLYRATRERSLVGSHFRKLTSTIEREVKKAREKRGKEEDELFSSKVREVKYT